MAFFSAYTPLADDPLRGERVRQCPVDFSKNELTYSRLSFSTYNLPRPVTIPAINGLAPQANAQVFATLYGPGPTGPYTGEIASPLASIFPNINNALRKVRG